MHLYCSSFWSHSAAGLLRVIYFIIVCLCGSGSTTEISLAIFASFARHRLARFRYAGRKQHCAKEGPNTIKYARPLSDYRKEHRIHFPTTKKKERQRSICTSRTVLGIWTLYQQKGYHTSKRKRVEFLFFSSPFPLKGSSPPQQNIEICIYYPSLPRHMRKRVH